MGYEGGMLVIRDKDARDSGQLLFFKKNYAKISRIAKNELFMSFSPQQR